MSKEELSRLFQQAGLVHFNTSPVTNTDLNHIDLKAVDHYYRSYYETDFINLPEDEQHSLLVNNYSIGIRKIQLHVYSNRIEITSPGALANTMTLEKIRYGNSAPRNIFLVKFLDNLRYFDGLGRGIPMMLKAMEDRIEFENIGELFRLTLHFRPPEE